MSTYAKLDNEPELFKTETRDDEVKEIKYKTKNTILRIN